MNMGWNPLNKVRDRLNGGVSARVNDQLEWRDKTLNARLDALEKSMTAVQSTNTALSASISDRLRTLEAAVDQLLREQRQA